jgi:hypothetical protein
VTEAERDNEGKQLKYIHSQYTYMNADDMQIPMQAALYVISARRTKLGSQGRWLAVGRACRQSASPPTQSVLRVPSLSKKHIACHYSSCLLSSVVI